MKVPFPSINHFNSSPYEPKSVLDLCGSPSPVSDQKLITTTSIATAGNNILTVDPLHQADDVRHVMNINPQFDDLDCLMSDWALHDDSNIKSFTQIFNSDDQIQVINHHHEDIRSYSNNNLSDFPYNYNSVDFGLVSDIPIYTTPPLININPNFIDSFEDFSEGSDYVDELIQLAECLDTDSFLIGQGILARLNQRLRSPDGKPLQRAAFYFKEALQSRIAGSAPPGAHRAASSFEIVQSIKAQKAFSSVSPIPMFAGFTASQAVLEALDGGGGGSVRVHVIDFDIGLGCHWASFMRALAGRSECRRGAATAAIRISAVVPEEYAAETRLIGESLALFARDLNIGFHIDFVSTRAFEHLSFRALKFAYGERVAVILSPAIFRRVETGFLSELRLISPHVVVHVDVAEQMGFGTASYRQAVVGGLEIFSTLLESLEAANLDDGGDWMRRIEALVAYPKVEEAVEAAGGSGRRRGLGWREAAAAAGLRQVGLSQFAEFQAECLVRRVQVRGFHVAKRQAEMLLSWHDRPLVATSAWRF